MKNASVPSWNIHLLEVPFENFYDSRCQMFSTEIEFFIDASETTLDGGFRRDVWKSIEESFRSLFDLERRTFS